MPLVVYGLETDPGVLRGWFEQLMTQGTYLLLIRTEAVDLTWAAALGATIICLVRFVGAAGWERRPRLAPLLVAWAPLFAIGPLFDLVENAFSLAMLTDPYGFPDWWALAHGVCARLKFGLAVLAGSIGVGSTIVIALPRSGRPAGGAAPLTSP